MGVSSRARRRAVLFGSLLVATMVLLTGCPDDAAPVNPIDSDGDLLIDVSSIERLYNVRFNLTGTNYRTHLDSPISNGVQCGVAADTECRGYELTRSLDFADPGSYESGAVSTALRPDDPDPANATNSGWVPIGIGVNRGDGTQFGTRFEGNGNTITNLYVRGSGLIGLFGSTDNAVISNLGIINARLYGGDAGGGDNIGGLVGFAIGTTVVASYAGGVIIDNINGNSSTGGLVGLLSSGFIVASYAAGDINGGAAIDEMGGLVGLSGGRISASYATGDVNGGAGNDNIGGIIGSYNAELIVASYATANSDGGEGANDNVSAFIGGKLGTDPTGNTTASYGFGMVTGNEGSRAFTPDLPTNVTSATGLTLANAGSTWDDAASLSLGAWDFGNASQPPALRYADYDGSREVFACANADDPPADAILIVKCGELIPGQRAAEAE